MVGDIGLQTSDIRQVVNRRGRTVSTFKCLYSPMETCTFWVFVSLQAP